MDQALGTLGLISLVTTAAATAWAAAASDSSGERQDRERRDHDRKSLSTAGGPERSRQPIDGRGQPDHRPALPWAAWLGSWVALLTQPPPSWMTSSMITMSAMMGAMVGPGSLPPLPSLRLPGALSRRPPVQPPAPGR